MRRMSDGMRRSLSKSRLWTLAVLAIVLGVTSPGSARPIWAREHQVRAQAFFSNGTLQGELGIQEEAPEGDKGPISWHVHVGMRNQNGQLVESGGGYHPIAFTYDPRLEVVHGTGEIPTQYFYIDSSGNHQAVASRITFDVTWRATSRPQWLNGPTPQVGTSIMFQRQAEASGVMSSPNAGTLSEPIVGNDSYPTVVTFMRQIGLNDVPVVPSGVCSYDLPFPVCV
jgi:hypothetical protein